MVAEVPVPAAGLAELLGLTEEAAQEACRSLARSYEEERRGFVLTEVAGGWRLQSHPELWQSVERYMRERERAKLSPAALETLAIVAYKQPISRAQISAVRGVDVDSVLRSLLQRGYVAQVGHDEGPGQAILYGTTSLFLEALGLARVEDLPSLGDFVPGADVVEALDAGLRGG